MTQEHDRDRNMARLWFDKVAKRNLSFQDREEPSITESATELEDIVRSSGAISWMGVAARREASGDISFVILHLLKDPNTILPDETEVGIEVLADELGSVIPIPFQYFLTDRSEYTPSGFKDELLARYTSVEGETWILERDEFLGDTNKGNPFLADFFNTLRTKH